MCCHLPQQQSPPPKKIHQCLLQNKNHSHIWVSVPTLFLLVIIRSDILWWSVSSFFTWKVIPTSTQHHAFDQQPLITRREKLAQLLTVLGRSLKLHPDNGTVTSVSFDFCNIRHSFVNYIFVLIVRLWLVLYYDIDYITLTVSKKKGIFCYLKNTGQGRFFTHRKSAMLSQKTEAWGSIVVLVYL